jgi:hypothetical protein
MPHDNLLVVIDVIKVHHILRYVQVAFNVQATFQIEYPISRTVCMLPLGLAFGGRAVLRCSGRSDQGVLCRKTPELVGSVHSTGRTSKRTAGLETPPARSLLPPDLHDVTFDSSTQKSSRNRPDILIFLRDCERFTLKFFPCSLHGYRSASLFTPKQALIRRIAVTSVAFYADGTRTRIVSGFRDDTLHLWDAVSGAHLSTQTQCGDHLGECDRSWDDTLRVWNAFSGVHLTTLSGHSNRVTSVAFSPDGTLIASGSDISFVCKFPGVR